MLRRFPPADLGQTENLRGSNLLPCFEAVRSGSVRRPTGIREGVQPSHLRQLGESSVLSQGKSKILCSVSVDQLPLRTGIQRQLKDHRGKSLVPATSDQLALSSMPDVEEPEYLQLALLYLRFSFG